MRCAHFSTKFGLFISIFSFDSDQSDHDGDCRRRNGQTWEPTYKRLTEEVSFQLRYLRAERCYLRNQRLSCWFQIDHEVWRENTELKHLAQSTLFGWESAASGIDETATRIMEAMFDNLNLSSFGSEPAKKYSILTKHPVPFICDEFAADIGKFCASLRFILAENLAEVTEDKILLMSLAKHFERHNGMSNDASNYAYLYRYHHVSFKVILFTSMILWWRIYFDSYWRCV